MKHLLRRLILWALGETFREVAADAREARLLVVNETGKHNSHDRWIMALWVDYKRRNPSEAGSWEMYGRCDRDELTPTEYNPKAYLLEK